MIIKTAANAPSKINSVGSLKKIASNGTQIDATIEPSETYLVTKTIASQIKNTIAVILGISIAITPKPVATPLPP